MALLTTPPPTPAANNSWSFTSTGPPPPKPATNLPTGIVNTGAGYVGNTQGNELVSNNLNKIIDENGQYIQQARQGAVQQANSRGLLNSSIAAGNAQGAAIQAALPIAQGDANAYHTTALDNTDNLNKILGTNISADAQIAAAGETAGAMVDSANINNQGALQRQQENLAFTGEQAGLTRDFQAGQNAYTLQAQYQNAANLQAQNAGLGLSNYLTESQSQLANSLLEGNQSFTNSAMLTAMQDPALMGDPQALGGYINFANGPMNDIINNLLNNLYGSYDNGSDMTASLLSNGSTQ